MNELVRQHTALDDSDLEWLHLLVSEWQLLSDLSFADLVLWVPTRDGTRYVSVARCAPTPAPPPTRTTWSATWSRAAAGPCWTRPWTRAGSCARVTRSGVKRSRTGGVHPRAARGRVLGVIARNTNLLTVRTPSRLELTYLQSASDLAR